jgi:hypothetical protein
LVILIAFSSFAFHQKYLGYQRIEKMQKNKKTASSQGETR